MGGARARWDAKYKAGYGSDAPDLWVVEQLTGLGPPASLLDIAGGRGRHAVWAAQRGFDTTLLDVSPVALRHAVELKDTIRTIEHDLEATEELTIGGCWDIALVCNFLHRPTLRTLHRVVAPGGTVLFVHPMVDDNYMSHRRQLVFPI